MSCIKTGAVVLVQPYNGVLVCDLFQCGDVIIANEGTDRLAYSDPSLRSLTHSVDVSGHDAIVHFSKFIAAPAARWVTLARPSLKLVESGGES